MLELVYPSVPAPVEKGGRSTRTAEMLPIIDEAGMVVSQASRSFCHSASRPLHPVVHLHIIDREGRIYLQKRSYSKKLLPGRWDTAVGGHVSYGESVLEALYREAREELGFLDFNPISIDSYVWESQTERELVNVFAAVGNFVLTPDEDEVISGRYWTPEKIRSVLGSGKLTPNFEYEFGKYADSLLALL